MSVFGTLFECVPKVLISASLLQVYQFSRKERFKFEIAGIRKVLLDARSWHRAGLTSPVYYQRWKS